MRWEQNDGSKRNDQLSFGTEAFQTTGSETRADIARPAELRKGAVPPVRVTSAAERRLFGAERKCQNQALWAVIRCAQFVKKEGAVVVPMSPGPDAPSAKPQFIMPLRNELLDTFTKRGDAKEILSRL